MRPEYVVPVKDGPSFENVPKAVIGCYKWETGYEPFAYAQLIRLRGTGFLLRMEAEETDPKADYSLYNQPVYKDSCLEFFVNFNPDQPKYMNFEMNSNGAFLAALRTGRKDKTPIHELTKDLPAVSAKKDPDRWSVRVFFPDAFIAQLFGKDVFRAGDRFLGNFYKCGDETPHPHYGMWSPIDADHPDFHQSSFFGSFVIEDEGGSDAV